MSNQYVDDALSDYFTDLLGSTEILADIEEDIAKSSIAEQFDRNKLESIPIKALSNLVSGDVVISKVESIINRPLIADKPNSDISKWTPTLLKVEASRERLLPENKSVEAHASPTFSAQTADKALEEVASKSVRKTVTQTVTNTATETDSYNAHKGRLERMLRQVTNLTASQDINVNSKVALQLNSSVEGDVSTLIEVTQPVPAVTPKKFVKSSTVISAEMSLKDALKVEANKDVVPILANQWNENGRPEWAQESFDILLLEVNGLQLAVPLMSLGQIYEIDDEITLLFGQSDWFMGLQKTPDGNVKVVDTAKFIMPERYRDQHNYKYIISIHDLYWGLAVDNIKQPITIDPEAIRWRPKRDSRPWMAGMVKDHMCVLLDIPKMGEILQKQDKNRID
jgi:chemotaxis signal transduction protein